MTTTTRPLIKVTLVALLVTAAFASGWIAGRTGVGSAIDDTSLGDVEKQFSDRMRSSALVGQFTVAGRESRGASPDRYDIASVAKVGEDLWQFNVRMRHEGMDLTLPITVPMTFVGDTAVVMLTDYNIPTLGTFTVRVIFYADRYAGTWQHGPAGGLMFGIIEKAAAPSS